MKNALLILLFAGFAAFTLPPAASAAGTSLVPPADEVVSDQPDGFVLTPAYPNPFNPRTSFTLSIERTQDVTVEVFNLLGRSVKVLYSGVMEADETRTFTFEADNLPSGIYLYRVRGEDFTATRQMTLLK